MSSDNLTQSIVGLGNPLLDILADVVPEFLTRYGLKLDNAILADDSHALMFQELQSYKAVYVAGGATQNSIQYKSHVFFWQCRQRYPWSEATGVRFG